MAPERNEAGGKQAHPPPTRTPAPAKQDARNILDGRGEPAYDRERVARMYSRSDATLGP